MSDSNNSRSKAEKDSDGPWLRKASVWEKVMDTGHRLGNFLIWYQLNLQTREPLKAEQVKETLVHLYRKVPNLGVCLGLREGTYWIRKATAPDVDFKVVRGQTVEEVRETLRNYRYSSETGPLFCGRLLEESPDEATDEAELDSNMKHKYFMFFGFHHGMVDGTTNMYIMGYFISLLNDVIANKPIDDSIPLGTFYSDAETNKVVDKKKQLIAADPILMERLTRESEINKNQRPFITSVFPKPNEKWRTVSLVKTFDESTTSKFVQKCRQEKATVNSAFTALANVALIDILIEKGVIQDSYRIQNFHLVNLRRYWENPPSTHALGCHIGGPLTMYTDTPRDLDQDKKFWDYVRSLHQEIKDHIQSGKVMLDNAFHSLMSPTLPYSKEFLLSEKEHEGDLVTSNLGNVTAMVTEGGEHVRVTNVLRSTTVHLLESPVVINFHSFRGKLSIIFDYNAGAVEKEVGEKFYNQISKRLLEILS